jgi:transposase
MIDMETRARIRRLFYADHWKVGAIARELSLHPETVSRAVETERFRNNKQPAAARPDVIAPYAAYIREIIAKYPRLCATRVFHMIRDRGYKNSVDPVRRFIATVRPQKHEAFLRLRTFPGEQGQVDWASFGEVAVGRARRKLSCFVITLSYSRALYLEFFFDQKLESFLRAHVNAFENWNGLPRTLLYDNLKSVVLERRGDNIRFHPRFVELQAHYHFAALPCQIRAANQKGRVERSIRYIRDSFFAARPFTTLADFNRQALVWRDTVANARSFTEDDSRSVSDAFAEEQPRLLALPANRFDAQILVPVKSSKTIYVRFDLNDYSIPPDAIGRQLSVAASESRIRIIDGSREIASHRRCYDRRQMILDPVHQEQLLTEKRKASGSVRGSRLANEVPQSEAFLDAAFQRGHSAAMQTSRLILLLDQFGRDEMRSAIAEALARNTPDASSVAYILNRRWRQSSRRPLAQVDLSRRPELQNINVQPHNPEIYDGLVRNNDSK